MRKNIIISISFLFLALTACDDYLETKPDQAILIPETLEDFQALLDNDRSVMNREPALGFIGSDEAVINDQEWTSLGTVVERNSYLWLPDAFEDYYVTDWRLPYEQVFYANVVMEGLDKLEVHADQQEHWNALKGSALFYRSYAFYNLLNHFSAPYDADHSSDLGIPLRMVSDINAPIHRASIEEGYQEVVGSLQKACRLLPETSAFPTRPNKVAAYALLSRIYLSMREYPLALAYADSCLALNHALIDYNALNAAAALPFSMFNQEVIFYSIPVLYGFNSTRARVNPSLLDLYTTNDLRRTLFFRSNADGRFSFKGSYANSANNLFFGLATNEIYLIKAECEAREGLADQSLETLNSLLSTRWASGTYVDYVADNAEEALYIILEERRKELLFRGLRWSDLRRLNQEPVRAITLSRTKEGITYTLPPNSPRYVYPIPLGEIQASGIAQNPRE